jgi:molecular chaperone DnaJ
MASKDFYDILDVNKTASGEELKKAYRKQALEWHPDRNKSPEAAERFKEVNQAYEVLSDPEKRSAYDRFGRAAFEPGGRGAGAAGNPFGGGYGGVGGQTYRQGPFTYTYYTGGQNSPSDGFDFGSFSDPFEIFEQFFGSPSPFGRTQRTPRYRLAVDFMEAAKGTEKEVEIGGRKRRIKIPAGVTSGQQIRFADFVLEVTVNPHKNYQREGQDLYVAVDVPFAMAALGGLIEAPTVDGPVRLKIRPGTQPGTMIRLKGRGLPYIEGSGKGDEYVQVKIAVPEKLTDRQRRALEELMAK